MGEKLNRREFVGVAAGAVLGARELAAAPKDAAKPSAPGKGPTAPVELGKTGIQLSRLGMGTGTHGWNHVSDQTRLGEKPFVKLLRYASDRGISYIDCADMYGTHGFVRKLLKEVPREKLVLLTKTVSRDAAGVRKDVDRFRKELGVDRIDIVLLHCMQKPDWPKKLRGPMDVLAEAKQKGWIRAHGCSCHTIEALRAAAETDWVDVDLARFNPKGEKMDDKPEVVAEVLKRMRAKGKGVLGMKILGEGTFKDGTTRQASLKQALTSGCVDAFCVGFVAPEQIDEITQRMAGILAQPASS